MISVATPATIKVPRIVVILRRRADGTLFTIAQQNGVEVRQWNSGLLRSRHIRDLDEAKKRINARLEPFCKLVEFVDPPGEAAPVMLGRG